MNFGEKQQSCNFPVQNLTLTKPKKKTGKVFGHSRTLSRVEDLGVMVVKHFNLTQYLNFHLSSWGISIPSLKQLWFCLFMATPVHFQPPQHKQLGICEIHPWLCLLSAVQPSCDFTWGQEASPGDLRCFSERYKPLVLWSELVCKRASVNWFTGGEFSWWENSTFN